MSVVTRFPPSPTGFMHIGNARTALFNWLYARHHGGTFLVRIEDTDRKRHSEEAVDAIIEGLKWLELNWDGEIVSQFSMQERHKEVAQALLDKGQAYHCYCSPEELEQMREDARENGRSVFYDRRWRDRDASEAPEGVVPVVRIKAPLEGDVTIEDKVQGAVTLKNEQLDDFIILRSDGTPTYMLSVVVDDHDMGVTHIMRGDDHLTNAFRQKIIYDAMGWDVPVFAHLPLIHGPDGGKFSKRHGAQSVEEYREMGYLAEAMRNYLLRLGWSHGDDEIIPTDKAVECFDFKGLGKSAARFDFAKLESLNAHYIHQSDNQELLGLVEPFFSSRHGVNLTDVAKSRLMAAMDELKSRNKTLLQLTDDSLFFAVDEITEYDDKAQSTLSEAGHDTIMSIHDRLAALEPFTADSIQSECKAIADDLMEGKMGKVGMPLRAALTGKTSSPSVFHAAEILGKEETLKRLEKSLEWTDKKELKQQTSN